MEEWCAKHDIGRFVGYNREWKREFRGKFKFHSLCQYIGRRIRGLFMGGKR